MSILEKYSAALKNKDEATMNELLHDDCLLYTSPSPRD